MEALDKLFIDFIKLFLQIEYSDEISVAFPQQSVLIKKGCALCYKQPLLQELSYTCCVEKKRKII